MNTFMEGNLRYIPDNNPLTYILTTAKLDATGQRCVARLADYITSISIIDQEKVTLMLMPYPEFRGQKGMIGSLMNLP